ncbi:MAG: thioredoxin family protein [Bacteroidetes bacterium]|nr:thioredoxin family protein [Bacteroidota bacterium]
MQMNVFVRLLAALVLTMVLSSLPSSAADLPDGVKVGDVAPDFSLLNVDGKQLVLHEQTTVKGLIVVFTCNHCPYSVKYEDRINALDAKYREMGYAVVAINPNDTVAVPEDAYSKMIERARTKKFTFPYLIDATQNVAKAYGARRTPHVFVLSRQKNNFRVEYIGAIDDAAEGTIGEKFVENAIDQLIAGKAPQTTFTKAVGCTIKWKKD